MKHLPISVLLALATGLIPSFGQEAAQPAAAPSPADIVRGAIGTAADPESQVSAFYAKCKEGKAAEGLEAILSTNPVVKAEDVKRVAEAFSGMVATMGAFVDFEIVRGSSVGKRTQVLRCVAHFERQPFVNEFTFYDPGTGGWRLVHLRYDANLATMFQEDVRRDSAPQSGR